MEVDADVEDGYRPSPSFTISDDVDEVTETEAAAVEEMTATRTETPPIHARIVVNQYDVAEENPWA